MSLDLTTLAPVYLVLGDAAPLVDDVVAAIVAAAEERCGLPAFNSHRARIGDGDPVEALVVARTVPMMAELRVVVVRDVGATDARFAEALLDYLERPCPSTVVVLVGPKFAAVKKGGKAWGSRITKAVSAVGVVVKRDARSVRPERFVVARAEAAGKRMSRPAAETLVHLVGSDLATLRQEVDKLNRLRGRCRRHRGGGRRLRLRRPGGGDVWGLTDALAARIARRR